MRIIVHGGKAHRDEFLAVGLICHHENAIPMVFRRQPTQEELDNPKVWVVDVGGIHDPEKRNFDHHQFEPEQGDCALSLVAKALAVDGMSYHTMFERAPWYKAVILQDLRGRRKVSEVLDVDSVEMDAISAIEAFVLGAFASTTGSFPVSSDLVKLAKELMARKVKFHLGLVEKFAAFDKNVTIVPLDTALGPRCVAWAPDMEPAGLSAWCDTKGYPVIATVTRDPRTNGACLYRLGQEGDALLDFRQVDSEDITFAHRSGFMVVLRAGLPKARHVSIIARALVAV